MAEGNNLVGVDIGSSSIKICQLQESRKARVLKTVAFAPLPPQTIVDGHVMNSSNITSALQELFAKHKIKQKRIALGVSGQSVIIRIITVPIMTAEELDQQIRWEAEQRIPFDIRDVHIDYHVLSRHSDRGQMQLLLVAAKRDEINDYAQLARQARLKPVCVDVDAFCVQNIFEVCLGLPTDQTIALLNMGASLISLNVITGGTSAFTRDISSGGNTINEQLQRQTNMDFEQAEQFKRSQASASPLDPMGLGAHHPAENVGQVAIEMACDAIAAEIQRSLDFFMANSSHPEVNRIYVTGGTSNLTHLRNTIAKRVHCPVDLFNPVRHLTINTNTIDQDVLHACDVQLAVAMGLSLRKEREIRQ